MESKDIESSIMTNNREGYQEIISEEQKYFLLNDEEVLNKIIEGLIKDLRLL